LRSELLAPQVASGSVKQCPLWAYLASQPLRVVEQDAELL
jgi:hypothetical protein